MASLPSHDVTLNKLDGYNYSLWSFKIEMLLQKEDLWEVVTENIPDEPKIEWKKKDSKARAIINLSIADSQIVHVKNLLTAKATWDTLKNIYERKTLSGKIYLLRKLYSLKLEEDKDMQQHITTMMELVDKLRTIGETLKDSHITAILLCSLPKSYSNLITMLESRPDDELTLEFTKNKLLDEHTRRVESSKDESTASKALKSLHGASSQRREKEKKFCSFCHKPNHSKEECWHYQKRNNSNKEYKYENFRRGNVPKYTNQSSVTQEQLTNQRTTKGPNPKALNCTQREASVHNWFVDSGATSHMAYDESFFTELNREQTQNVVVANGNKLQVKGIGQGESKVITPQGKTDTLLLTKVLYIPELTDNLLSVSAATSNGCKVTFNRDWCTIERDNTALANGILDNGMYRLHLDDNPQTRTFKANVAKQNHCKNKNCLMLWHDRLGHRNIESIKKIRNENLARGLSLNNCSHSTDCVQCIQGKLTETPFPKKTEYRATETLQLVHSDICGPLPTNSLSGKRYFITFTDDYSRYTKTYLLKGKDEAYEKIKDYVISAHTEFGKNIQTIRTDNGREYVNRQVEDFLNQSGIKHQLTVPYSPAQNGVAERKNRSLMEMTRCMLFDSGLPQSLWAEAVTTANYLHNRIPSKATDKTPFKLWTNRKPSLKHLKRFGCKAFAYIPKIKRNKLDSKVIEGIFLGYDDRSKGYRILHDTDNITISRSVKFIEKENGFHHASTKTTSPQVLSTDLTPSNHIGNAEESQEPGTQSENLEDSETEDYLQPGTSTGTQVVTQRRSTRPTKGIPPIRNDYMLYKTEAQDIQTPTNYSEVLQLPKIEREKWLQAMNEELNSLEKNNVWELTPLPKDKKIIGCKWTYKQKLNSKGEIERYKARLVAKGFNQKFGRDYEETFAPIVKHSTIRAFLAASVYKGMQVIHLDVKTAFLHGDLDKELYMELPEGLHTKQTNEVCKLKKAIYGLKQAGRSWNTKIASTLIKNNFKQSTVDPCLFTKNEENHSIYLILYVDDMLLASDSEIIIQNTVKTLEKEFEIKNLGDPTQFIGIEISRNREGELLLSQKSKIQELVERYNLQEAKPTFTPMESGYPGISDEKLLPNNVQYQQLIGSLLYLSVVSRPDIAAPVCILSSRNQNPRNCDWNAAKRIVRYLKTTKELELRISNQKPPTLETYSDATWASDNTDRKSLSGNLFLLGSNPISWMTGKQGCVSLSSTEAELISAAEASQELLWLLDLLKDLELEQKAPIYFHQDNQSCLKICSSEKVSSRTKHIATKIHHLKDLQKKTVIKMIYCPTGDMKADILTKPLPRPTFEKLRYNLDRYVTEEWLNDSRIQRPRRSSSDNFPHFDNTTALNVTTTSGTTAFLPCRVKHLGDRTVSWIRKKDLHVLTVGKFTYTNDQRFQTLHPDNSDDWTLQVRYTQHRDAGLYECQVSTVPKMSHFVNLNVIEKLEELCNEKLNYRTLDKNLEKFSSNISKAAKASIPRGRRKDLNTRTIGQLLSPAYFVKYQNRLIVWLTNNNKINLYQTAYRSQYCTTDQRFYFCQSIIDSFQETPPKKTTAIFLDMTSDFDRVWREKLREKLNNIGVRGKTLIWIADFLRGRKLKVRVNGEFSKEGRTWAGVTQGSVLSPLLYLLYINDIHPYLTEDTKVACYADDIAIWHTSSSIEKSEKIVNTSMRGLEKWAMELQMTINPIKPNQGKGINITTK
ncbi:hypothetical protein LAZ67_19000691 [Cordylochernes scorpioides]|uniref:Retrovirus-related Pol polyprotein from transposon TNT 1-94 n=1 Tax=Cordylochernes scorpioides TaxID=51811 RepID=A0ABY6LL24_9ARAC|nr:hypothetical protein LAZ67_19000691 [Cordylochernes scorpioides]